MPIKVTIQSAGINLAARLRDDALPALIKLTQEFLDTTEGMVETSPLHADKPPEVDKVNETKTTEDRIKGALKNVAPAELLNQLQWKGYPEKILLLAAWGEANGTQTPWKCEDIENAFSQAKEKPASTFGREVKTAIKAGWLHAQTSRSYVVTRSGWNKIGEALGTVPKQTVAK